MENKLIVEDELEVVSCGDAKLIKTITYEEDGKQYTEELFELVDPEGRASTINVVYTAGSSNMKVTFSDSGHGPNVWCSYQVGSKPFNSSNHSYDFTTTRYAKDVARTFDKVYVSFPVPGVYDQVGSYDFLKYIRNSSTQANPTRQYRWILELRGSGSINK